MTKRFGTKSTTTPRRSDTFRRRNWSDEWRDLKSRWHPGEAIMVQDEPKVRKGEDRKRFLETAPKLVDAENPKQLTLVTPYLIPGDGMYATLANYRAMNIAVTVVVPGLDSNNQALVHSHYKKHRRRLLASGVDLYEIRSDPSPNLSQYSNTDPARNKSIALHVKSAMSDGRRCFIGSLNLDPRSIEINTENGLFINSPGLGADLNEYFQQFSDPANAWHVTSDGEDGTGTLRWRSEDEELLRQPAPGVGRRIADFFYGLLPIEGLL